MKRRLLAIAMTLAMALSLLPVTALAEGTEDRTGSEPVGSEQQVLTNEPSDEGATTPTDEESATDTETPVEDPEQGTEPEASTDEAETATTTEETGQDDGITTEQELIDGDLQRGGREYDYSGRGYYPDQDSGYRAVYYAGRAGHTISGTVENGTSFISVRTDGEFAMVDCKFVPTGNVTPNGFITIAAKEKVTVTGCTFGSRGHEWHIHLQWP